MLRTSFIKTHQLNSYFLRTKNHRFFSSDAIQVRQMIVKRLEKISLTRDRFDLRYAPLSTGDEEFYNNLPNYRQKIVTHQNSISAFEAYNTLFSPDITSLLPKNIRTTQNLDLILENDQPFEVIETLKQLERKELLPNYITEALHGKSFEEIISGIEKEKDDKLLLDNKISGLIMKIKGL